MARTIIRADGIKEDTLEDKDGNTKVQVEESSDENKIRFDTAGSERMIIDDSGNVGVGTSSPISKLDVAGKIAITSEVSTPSAPADGKGWLYTKSDGKIYWQSSDVSETDLTSGGGSGSGDITSVVAGVGLSGGATSGDATLAVDFSEFSTVTPANGDFLATLDSDGSTEQKTAISALATLMAGTASSTGLSASNSVLSVSDLHPVGVDGSANQLMTDDGDGTMTSESNMTFDGNTLTVSGNVSSNYVTILDNDQSSAGHVLKLLTDGNGSGSRILEMEDGDGDVVFRARADGRFGFGPDGVSSMGAGTFVVGIDNSSHTADIAISRRLQHLGDSNTYLDFPAADQVQIVVGGVDMLHITEDDSQDKIVFNEGGADVDFIVESPNETKALYLHAGNEVFHINHGESNFQTKIHNTNDLALTVNSAGVVLNDDGHATNDFRVESDNNDHMLFVDAGNDKIGINDNSPISELSVAGKISITAESSTPSAPADGHGWLYTKSDGKIYWQSNDVSETDLTAGGSSGDITAVVAGVGLSGGATSGDATLTIDFSEFNTVTPANGDFLATLDSDGSTEQKTAISALATLMAGTSSSTGLSASNSVLSIADLHPVGVNGSANQLLTDDGDGTLTSESKALVDGAKITIGDGTAEDSLLVFDGNAADFRIGIDDDSDTLEIGAGAAHDTTAAIIIDSSGHVTKIGQDSPSSDQVLTWDGSKAVWSAAGGGSSSKVYIETFQQLKTQGSGISISSYSSGIDKELLTIGGYGFNQIKDYIMTSADGSTWTAWDNTSTSDLDQHYFRNQVTGDTGYSSGAYGDDGYFQSKVISTAHIIPVSGTITKIWLKGQQLDGKELRMRAWVSSSGISNSANGSSGMEVGAAGSHIVFTELNDGAGSPTFWNGIQIGGSSGKDYFQEYETLSGYDVTAGQLLLVTFDCLGDEDNRVTWFGVHYMFEITSS